MAYVARYAHDVFMSYAHNDDRAWIEGFQTVLKRELAERLGHPPGIWQDDANLRLGQNWAAEIEDAIKGTAVFLAIVSPSYRASDWCGRERKYFVDQFPSLEKMTVPTKSGEVYRFLKVIKMPWPDDAHLEFFGEAQHVDFYDRCLGQDIADELMPGTDGFQSSMRRTAHALANLLLAMRRMGETVFVATPAEDVASQGRALYDELAAQGYDIQPDGPLDEFFSDAAVQKILEPAVVSIHLLGSSYDAGAERLVKLARELHKPQIFWISREGETQASGKQKDLIASLSADTNGDAPPTVLTGPASRMIQDVRQLLVPRPGPKPTSNGDGTQSVYVICDPSSPADAAFGQQLGRDLQADANLNVSLPVPGPAMMETHERLLRDCDGVLLYRDEAPDPWFWQHFADVMSAGQRGGRTKPLRAKAFLVDDPDRLPNVDSVYPRKNPFDLADLEPFLAALGNEDAHA